jgi:hypothetical protein
MEADPELLPDQLGQARGGPQFGGEPVLGRPLAQPAEDDLLLGGRELGGAARDGASAQSFFAITTELGEPAANRAGIDVKELSDFLSGVAFEDAANGEESSMFQFGR